MTESAWGSDDPTKADLPFLHVNALSDMAESNATFANPATLVQLIERADKLSTE